MASDLPTDNDSSTGTGTSRVKRGMAEMLKGGVIMFLHYGSSNSQLHGEVTIDATQWHNWAVEWTPDHITAFVDGKQWFHTEKKEALPPGPMHLCIQLDWFPRSARGTVKTSTMQVDWVKQYALSPAETGSAAPRGGRR